MSTMTTDVDDAIFDATTYDLPIPKIDGIRSESLSISFGGTLDRTKESDLEELGRMQLLEEVTVTVRAVVAGKSFSGKGGSDDPKVGYQVRLHVTELIPQA